MNQRARIGMAFRAALVFACVWLGNGSAAVLRGEEPSTSAIAGLLASRPSGHTAHTVFAANTADGASMCRIAARGDCARGSSVAVASVATIASPSGRRVAAASDPSRKPLLSADDFVRIEDVYLNDSVLLR